jgi:hypothetical protein
LPADATFERSPLTPEITARGGASVGWVEGKSAFLRNPAAESSGRSSFSAAYSQPFGVDDLSEGLLSYSRTIAGRGTIGLGWGRFGATGYHEDRQSVAVSWGEKIGRVGLRLERFSLGIDGFGSRAGFGVNVGGVLKIRPELQLGMALNSLNRPEIPNPLPRSVEVGFGLQAIPELALMTDLRFADDSAFQIRAGGELTVSPHFVLRAGMHNRPWAVTLGFGIQLRSVVVDYAWVNHSRLEGTHQIAVGWEL